MTESVPSESVVVVGAGVIGIACAHYLSKAGFQVTVIDQSTIGNACSSGNCGYICPSHVLPLTEPGAFRQAMKSLFNRDAPFRVQPRLSLSQWRWFVEFAKRCTHRQMLTAGEHLKAILDSSMTEYRKLMESEALDCEWQTKGLLYVLQTEAGMEEFAKTDRILTEHFGVDAVQIKGDELKAFDPSLKHGLAGAYHYPDDASVRPDRLNAQWSRKLCDKGVNFVEQCKLTGIQKRAGRVTALKTSQAEMVADHYVFAVGAWSPLLAAELGYRAPIEPGKGYSVTMQRPDPCPDYPMLFPEHKVGVSPFADGYRIGSMMEFTGYDSSIPPRRIEQLRESAEHYLVAPHTDGEQQTWFGWRPMTWDSLPIIGRVPNLENACVATGHNMLGLSLATGTGKLIAEILRGQTCHIDISGFSPVRF